MRLLLKIKEGAKNVNLTRITFKPQTQTTDELIQFISKYLKVSSCRMILRIELGGKQWVRIIKGWPLAHYQSQSGMKIDIEIINHTQQAKSPNYEYFFQQKCITGPNQVIEELPEEENGCKEVEIQDMVIECHQKLLGLISRKKYEEFVKLLKQKNHKLGECENLFFKKQLKGALSQLGNQGWSALHYACFNNSGEIVDILLDLNVNLNIKSSDDWLPIQLAICERHIQIIEKLVSSPSLQINIATSRGSPLSLAVKQNNWDIIRLLTKKQIKFDLKDNIGRTIYDYIGNQSGELYSKFKEIQQAQQNNHKSQQYNSLVSLYRGQLIKVRSPPWKSVSVYVMINPYEKIIAIFSSRENYPSKPENCLKFSEIKRFCRIDKKERSWYMKEDLSYFVMEGKKKQVFGCNFEQTMDKWIQAFQTCCNNTLKYSNSIKNFVQNDKVICDKLEIKNSPKKKTPNFLDNFACCKSMKTEDTASNNTEGENANSSEISEKKTAIQNNQDGQAFKYHDFQIESLLGEGSFGTVFLARHHKNCRKYALKCFNKKQLILRKQIKYTLAEISILKQLHHPFIVNLHFAFQTPSNAYLGLDYCPGQDLSQHLMRETLFPEADVQIYGAQILLALQYLHQKKIIYRDLKPENVMLGEDGHVKLIDFGLSKQADSVDHFRAKSFCGSPAYISPEMLEKKGVGKQSDYYCLGAVLYEMLIGEPPYFSDDIEMLYDNIKYGKLSFPKNISSKSKSFLSGLLQRNPKKRLGFKSIEQIKKHQFFKNIDWKKIYRKQVKAPIREGQDSIIGQQDEIMKVKIFFYPQLMHQDEDYSEKNKKINRIVNFSFVNKLCLQI